MKKNEKISNLLAIVAGGLSVVAFGFYDWTTIIGEKHHPVSSWLVWSFLTLLNASSYMKLTSSLAKSILPTANAFMTLVTLVCVIRSSSFGALSNTEKWCLAIGVLAGLAWLLWGLSERVRRLLPTLSPAGIAQLLLQASIIVGFIPTFIEPVGNEPWFPWLLWTACFATQFLVVKIKLNRKSKLEFAYPVAMFVCHGTVFVLALL